jgi:hypothetical protein
VSDQPSATASWSAQFDAPTAGPPPPVAADGASVADERPEIVVGAAFATGFVFAMILKRLTR